MRYGLFILIAGILLGCPVYADGLLLIDSLERLESCNDLAGELNLASVPSTGSKSVRILEYKSLYNKVVSAQEKFYKLEIDESSKIFDEVALGMSDAIIIDGSLDDIHNLFQQALIYKILILLSQKDEAKAIDFLGDYMGMLSTIPLDSKKIHPSIRNFLVANLSSAKSLALSENESAQILAKALKSKYRYRFDGTDMVPATIVRSRHLLLVEKGGGQVRSLVRNFSNDISLPISLGNYGKNTVILVLDEESFGNAKSSNAGFEMLFCRENGDGLILADGKVLSKEEAIKRGVNVEIIKTEEVELKKKWYNRWWIYAAGGTVAAAIVTSIILINTSEGGGEFYRDRIQFK